MRSSVFDKIAGKSEDELLFPGIEGKEQQNLKKHSTLHTH
jgi:hypothetical protein